MSEAKTITINGRHYDAHSGLMVDSPGIAVTPQPSHAPSKHAHPSVTAKQIHSTTQRSSTLNRRTIKRPEHKIIVKNNSVHKIIPRTTPSAHRPSIQSTDSRITKFAPHPVATQQTTRQRSMDIGPAVHPHVTKAHAISKAKANIPLPVAPSPRVPQQQHAAKAATVHPTAHTIKETALATAVANTTKHKPVKKQFLKRHPRTFSIVTASIALVMLGGYFTYLNMPSLSVRVAAAQAGVNATYPSYQPDGYSLNGVVGYSKGQVSMKFAANGGPQNFTINQTKSSWDSSAVLDNYVSPRAGVSYIPYTERGLTIYTYDNNAAWVNGGVLYTIEGNAPLSSEQIRRIATSLI
ncbi:hypothetical protein A2707_00245 [Candidatus Saccharibacteria bacterium RIFCSPHIGHO2_01_FULL_45_15]|nr:MAG: hypothetical protein A2707_00245 [Candidatus Saccharibacteria bacterium RIFCSPHIGHO2_01_FULL_45_15]OGL28546.1 MAG: hypothetical protein A3C39_03810 [Candidatus Saccharibacteria bacterium RIFCSPHIGHO2_02_FULL_46_12]OGL32115.1 MAG: hypothetical protein A3E76_03900 [Candidatus Saccharibacteria bacterium RIFCSPHIGHO2_12_FULL_44_22]